MGSKIDMTGQVINKLTVLSISDNRSASGSIKWICKCECGNICEIDGCRLRNGKAVSCGCESKKALLKGRGIKFNDLTGQTFGRLKVLERCEDKIFINNRVSVQWLCQCTCGRTTKVLSSNLITGNTQSCGLCGEKSHGNNKIDQLLTIANIPFIREKRFESCKDKAMLPFDFYVNNKYLIEYDGNYHYKEKNTIFNQIEAQKHDQMKNEWCKLNHIPLIRIPYTHYNDLCLEDLLLETSKYIMPT